MLNVEQGQFARSIRGCIRKRAQGRNHWAEYETAVNSKNVLSVSFTDDIDTVDSANLDHELLCSAVDDTESLMIHICVDVFTIGPLNIPDVMFRLLKHDEVFDIDFNFRYDDFKRLGGTSPISSLQEGVRKLALDFGAANYYAGMEPASDLDTRFFTNEKFGPLR